MWSFGVRGVAERGAKAGSGEQVGPERLQLLPAHAGPAQHAEADVGPASRKWEHPRVPRQQVWLEHDPEPPGRHAAEVLPDGVPGAEVGFTAGAHGPPSGGVMAGGRYHPPGVQLVASGEPEHDLAVVVVVVAGLGTAERGSLAHLD